MSRRYPPFCGLAVENPTECMSRDGAHKLAEKIRAAWASVGIDLPCEVEQVRWPNDVGTTRGAIFAVRMPTLVNGLHRDRAAT